MTVLYVVEVVHDADGLIEPLLITDDAALARRRPQEHMAATFRNEVLPHGVLAQALPAYNLQWDRLLEGFPEEPAIRLWLHFSYRVRTLTPQEIVLKDMTTPPAPPFVVIPIVVKPSEKAPDPDTETRFANIELD